MTPSPQADAYIDEEFQESIFENVYAKSPGPSNSEGDEAEIKDYNP